jgi:hypothetical protein
MNSRGYCLSMTITGRAFKVMSLLMFEGKRSSESPKLSRGIPLKWRGNSGLGEQGKPLLSGA